MVEGVDLGRTITAFIGPEGSGKTTLAQRLAGQSGKPYLSTSAMIRWHADNDPGTLGDECRDMFEKNGYLSGPSLIQILTNRVAKPDTAEGFILDGGFRTLEETLSFQEMLEKSGRAYPLRVSYLIIPEETAYERLLHGENARKRDDDTPEGIANRLEKFYFQLDERLAAIEREKSWTLIRIDATPPIEQTYRNILHELTRLRS